MKKLLLAAVALAMSAGAIAQISKGGAPFAKQKGFVFHSKLQSLELPAPNAQTLATRDAEDGKNGVIRKIGQAISTNLNPQNSGVWETLSDGSKIWRLKIASTGALALGLYYNQFNLPQNSKMFVYSEDLRHVIGAFTSENNPVGSTEFATEIITGSVIIVEYWQAASVTQAPVININEVAYIYRDYENPFMQNRDFGDSQNCEININCTPVGTPWQDEKRGVVRILVKQGSSFGWCSGSLVNNTNQDCTPYILTADHCSGSPGPQSSASDLNQWVFYFNYEAAACTDPASEGSLASQSITGCAKQAQGGNGGDDGSDFYLVLLNSAVPAAYNAYYNGWDRSTTAPTGGGAGIHHPAGDIKKISTYSATPTSTSWGSVANTHWQFAWSANANGHGVTEGGSSGSPMFNSAGLIVGTLTGGGSFCSALTSPDQYGKMSFHWNSNTIPASNNDLQPFLDPAGTNPMTLAGIYQPCTPQPPVADFAADNTTPCPNTTVTFTDMSTGTPTTWAWVIAPGTFTYVGGTSASSQNPQVQFTATGTYTITLTATNGLGSDNEVKNAYITASNLTTVSLPYNQNFETGVFPQGGISIVNPDGGAVAWGTDGIKGIVSRPAGGNTGSNVGCAAINCFNYEIEDEIDYLVLPAIDLSGATNPQIRFKRAYRPYNTTYFETLNIEISTNCGTTYTSIYQKAGTQLQTLAASTSSFTPTLASHWLKDSVNLSSYIGQDVILRFKVTNGFGNNLYIDDINVDNVVVNAGVSITATPNPSCQGQNVTFTATPVNGGTPTYQWTLNGGNVGTNSATYSNNALVTGDQVNCIMTSSLGSAGNNPATSNTITVTVNPIPATPTITQNGVNLSSSSATGNQWYLNGSPIAGATSQNYTAIANGNYTVVVTTAGCSSAASSQTSVTTVGIEEEIALQYVIVYPNPTTGDFTLSFDVVTADRFSVEITNALGQVVYTEKLAHFSGSYKKNINLGNHGKGVYFIKLRNSHSEGIKRVVVY